MPDLAFCTTKELIDEVLSRHTFLGVIIQSADEHRGGKWQGVKQFKVHFNDNLSPSDVAQLLATVSGEMDLHC